MSVISQLGRQIGQVIRSAALVPCSVQLANTRTFVYHRSSKAPFKHVTDFDDGYHYRNGELQYAQTLRNKQEVTLGFDAFLHKFSKRQRQNNWITYPNCQCLDGLKEIEKRKPPQPRPKTACGLHEYAVSYYDM